MFNKAVFLDKDGTLIENVPYNVDLKKIRFAEGVLEGLRRLAEAHFKLVIVTNQSGVALGKFKEDAIPPLEAYLRQTIETAGAQLDGFFYCPHHPEGRVLQYAQRCFCRKPNPGMFFQASRELNINLAASWMIGDILDDVEAARRVDCRSVLLDNGNETEWEFSPLRRPHYTVHTFSEAVDAILAAEKAEAAAQQLFMKASPAKKRTSKKVSVDA
jgi:D,D-heptose 1,7-bisphosphate phosphatase